MNNLLSHYRELIQSPQHLSACENISGIDRCIAYLKHAWGRESDDDGKFLLELQRCNQQIHNVPAEHLRGRWLPYRYNAITRSVGWCLPREHATEPFHDQYVARCRQQVPFNHLIQPSTCISQMTVTNPAQPAGFIFHLSRCGSTLISGSLTERTNTSVLSESSLLTEYLLDRRIDKTECHHILPSLLNTQGKIIPGRDRIIVKWNAWDLFHWRLIRDIFPQVPVLLVIRDPVEILASHARMAGRHMAGDPSLAELDPALTSMYDNRSLLDFRIEVLSALLESMRKASNEPNVKVVDYRQLNAGNITGIAAHFGITLKPEEFLRIRQRLQFHSKYPEQPFDSDREQKQQLLSDKEKKTINAVLSSNYQQLLDLSLFNFPESAHAG